jgi:hypothetical protein
MAGSSLDKDPEFSGGGASPRPGLSAVRRYPNPIPLVPSLRPHAIMALQPISSTMKTLKQVQKLYKSGTLDGRDIYRLAQFIPQEQLKDFGLTLQEGATHEVIPYTRKNVLAQLEKDVAFGFEKALNQRGISSGLMFNVVKMWNWVLEDGLEDFSDDNYAQYGLPLFKATAIKYGFKDEIDGKDGDEYEFSSDYGYDY